MNKKVTEPYLVDALSFTEAEARITEDYVAAHEGDYPDSAYLAEEVERQFQAIFPSATQATAETAA